MSFYLFYLLVILIVGLTSYLVAASAIYCVIVTIVFAIYFVTFEIISKRKISINRRKRKDLSIFLHDFLSVYYSETNIDKSLEFATNSVSNELKEELKMIEDYKSNEKLKHLSAYFSNDLYELFLGIVKDKSSNSKDLLNYIKDENEHILKANNDFDKEIKKTVLEYLILWIVAALILIAMRFAIHNYFIKVSKSIYYLVGISLFYLVFIVSVHLLVRGCIKKYE